MVNMETAEAADTGIGSEEDRIRDVWNHNLEEEFKNICRVVQVWIIQLKFLFLISTRFVLRNILMSPWTQSSQVSWRDPLENLNQMRTFSISY